ncbi:MAG: hypothetical protein U0798_15550 [Gemmataceae bacterium]
MPRFVLLEHDWPERHFDFMLEGDHGQLLTWRLPILPSELCVLAAERLPDHRRAYLDYEGPISGNRGTVVRRAAGTFRWLDQSENAIKIEWTLGNQLLIAEWNNLNKTWTFGIG